VTGSRGYSVLELVVVLAVMTVLAAIVVPKIGAFKANNDTHDLSSALSVAKLRGASNFTQARLFVDLAGGTHRVEWWQKTGVPGWVAASGLTPLSSGDGFAFGMVGTPPPDTQAAISQAPACLDNAGNPIGATACVVFNSRGVPIDATGAPTNNDALYVTDGKSVGAVTVSAAGLISVWTTPMSAAPTWAHK